MEAMVQKVVQCGDRRRARMEPMKSRTTVVQNARKNASEVVMTENTSGGSITLQVHVQRVVPMCSDLRNSGKLTKRCQQGKFQ